MLLAPFEPQAARESAPTIASRLRRFIRILSEEVTRVTNEETAIRADETPIPLAFHDAIRFIVALHYPNDDAAHNL